MEAYTDTVLILTKYVFLKRRFIVGSIISDNYSTMKALSKHRFQYIKVSTHIFASAQLQRNEGKWHKKYYRYYLYTTMLLWSNTLIEYCMEEVVGCIASYKEEYVSKNCDFLKVNTYCGLVVKNNIKKGEEEFSDTMKAPIKHLFYEQKYFGDTCTSKYGINPQQINQKQWQQRRKHKDVLIWKSGRRKNKLYGLVAEVYIIFIRKILICSIIHTRHK